MNIEVVPYDPIWLVRYDQERIELERALESVLVRSHHIGSTSVEGLCAKPIIDVLLEVVSLKSLDDAASRMENLGYEVMGEFGIPRRRYFRKGRHQRTHHVHAFVEGDSNVVRHVAFRDYLRAHPAVCLEYGTLKTKLANECGGNRDVYCDGKDGFIKYHEAKGGGVGEGRLIHQTLRSTFGGL